MTGPQKEREIAPAEYGEGEGKASYLYREITHLPDCNSKFAKSNPFSINSFTDV